MATQSIEFQDFDRDKQAMAADIELLMMDADFRLRRRLRRRLPRRGTGVFTWAADGSLTSCLLLRHTAPIMPDHC